MNIEWREFGRQAQAFGLAIGVHLLAALFVVLGTIDWVPFRQEQPVGLLIEAVIVDTSELQEQRQAARQAAEREELRQQRARELEQQREREEQRQRELEEQRRVEQEEERQRQQQLEEQRRQQQIEEQRRKEAEDRLEQLRRERERKLEEERLQQQRELEQLRAEREAAERKRAEAEEQLRRLEQQRQREAEQQRLDAEAEAQRQAEFRAGQLATKAQAYQLAIQQVVTQNWLRPPTAQEGLSCEVDVRQIPGGEVISANITGRCNADAVTRRSIIAAVERAGNLPYRGFEDVFEREIRFNFIYEGE